MKTLTLPLAVGVAFASIVIVGAFAVSQSQQRNLMLEDDHSLMMGEHEEMYEICEEYSEEMHEECEEHVHEHEDHMEDVEHDRDNHDSDCPMIRGMNR